MTGPVARPSEADRAGVGPPPGDDEPRPGRPPVAAGSGRRWPLALAAGVVAAVVGAGGALGVLAVRGAGGDEELQTFVPSSGGFVVDLGPEWSLVDTNPEPPSVFGAQDPDRGWVLLVTTSLLPSASRLIEVVSSDLGPSETAVSTRSLDGSRALLHVREGGMDTVYLATTRACGTLVTVVTAPGPLGDGGLAEVEEVAGRIRPDGELTPPPAADPGAGFQHLEGDDVGLAVPAGFELDPSDDHCLLAVDGAGRSLDVTFLPVAETSAAVAALDQVVEAGGGLPEPEATGAGPLRLVVETADSPLVLYLVNAGAGMFVVRYADPLATPGEQPDLDVLDQVAASLTYTGSDDGRAPDATD